MQNMNRNGFSLLELLVVMLIMSVALGLFLGYNHAQRDVVMLRSAVGEARQFMRVAQGFALLEGRDNACVYLPQDHLLRETLRGKELRLPEAVRFGLGDGEPQTEETLQVALFFADGSAQGGELEFLAADQAIKVKIDPVLGETFVVDEAG